MPLNRRQFCVVEKAEIWLVQGTIPPLDQFPEAHLMRGFREIRVPCSCRRSRMNGSIVWLRVGVILCVGSRTAIIVQEPDGLMMYQRRADVSSLFRERFGKDKGLVSQGLRKDVWMTTRNPGSIFWMSKQTSRLDKLLGTTYAT